MYQEKSGNPGGQSEEREKNFFFDTSFLIGLQIEHRLQTSTSSPGTDVMIVKIFSPFKLA
jgi:hypothetical protein